MRTTKLQVGERVTCYLLPHVEEATIVERIVSPVGSKMKTFYRLDWEGKGANEMDVFMSKELERAE